MLGSRRQVRGFTLIELLVVIGIISLLCGILVPTLAKARQSAKRVKASSDLHELVSGYIQFTIANRGHLPYGFTPPTVNGQPVTADLPKGTPPPPTDVDQNPYLTGEPALRYPWRLVKYVGNMWPIIWAHHEMPAVRDPNDPLEIYFAKYYELSIRPGYGLNTIFLGGHAGGIFGGFVDANGGGGGDRPNVGKHVAFMANEIRRSSQQIVFTETRVDPRRLSNIRATDAEDDGYFYVFPPRGNSASSSTARLWEPSADGTTCVPKTTIIGGFPNTRYGPKQGTLVGFFDGHVASLSARELDDMRLWSPRADRADWTFYFK